MDKGKKKYDKQRIGELIGLLYAREELTEQVQAEIDSLFCDDTQKDDLAKALWDYAGRRSTDPEKIKEATRSTLTGIAGKCPGFPIKPAGRRPFYRRVALGIAAAIVPLMLLGGFLLMKLAGTATEPGQGDITARDFKEQAAKSNREKAGSMQVISIVADTIDKEFSLPDGTLVRLTQGGSLEYGADFVENRKVTLRGNAFFSVTKTEGKRFEVLYNDITVRVLGTEFYMSESSSTAEVTLKSGSLEILTAGRSVILSPKQKFVIDLGINDFSVTELSETQMARMIRGRLHFRGTPLNEALVRTGEFFGVQVDAPTLLNSDPVRLEFNLDDELEDVLFVLKTVSGDKFDYTIAGGKVILEAR